MNYCLQKYTTHQFTYLYVIYFKTYLNIQKNDVNPTGTSGDTCKTIFVILFKLFSIGDSFKFKATQETRLI